MKTITILAQSKKMLACVVLLFSALIGFSQPDYTFKNSTLIAGTDMNVGAKYRFSKIKTGVDGIITIKDITGGISLNTIDGTGSGGFDEAFQPEINVPKKSKGYVEFQLDFVTTGTSIPAIMVEVPLTAIDIDGYVYPDEKIFEFDEFDVSAAYYIAYDFIGTSLTVNMKGKTVHVENKTAVDYPAIDTVQKDVMFTMVHAGVTSVTFRVGANNKSKTTANRLRSVYFKKFNFPLVSILSQKSLLNFNGKKDNNTITLNWEFAEGASIKECVVERSINGQGFLPIGTSQTDKYGRGSTYNYTDIASDNGNYTYRLKLTDEQNKSFYSQVLFFNQSSAGGANKMGIFPNVIQSKASVQISSETSVKTSLQIVDYSGRVVYSEPVILKSGMNSINLELAGKVSRGNYLVVLPVNGKAISGKIIIQ